MTTPNTPANGGQIPGWKTRTKQKYGAALMAGMNEESVETLGIQFMKEEIADLRASLAAPTASKKVVFCPSCNTDRTWPCGAAQCDVVESFAAPAIPTITAEQSSVADDEEFDDLLLEFWKDAHNSSIHSALKSYKGPLVAYVDKRSAPAIPTVDRNSVPNTVGFAWPMPPPRNGQSSALFDDGYEEGWAKAIDTVRAMLAAPVAQPAAPTDEPTDREALIACLEDDAAKLADANPDDEMVQTMREAAALLESDGAQPAAQVAVTGEAANPMFNIIPTMTKADEADAAKGICPACKYLGLKEINIAHGMRFMQCRKCKDIVVLATPATVKTADGL